MIKRLTNLALSTLLAFSATAQAYQPQAQEVTDSVYALIGPTDGRTPENHALNNNQGFVVTDAGVVLIDSGASQQGAALIAKAIAEVTDKPVTHVINTGSQDHRWLGNDHFAQQGAEIIALQRTVKTQRAYAEQHRRNLEKVLGEAFSGTTPYTAENPIAEDHHVFSIGGVDFELHWYGDAHFPGDAVLWLPQQKVVFSGDVIYVDRMLGLHPWSDLRGQQAAFEAIEALEPEWIVPGHGRVSDLAKARRDTGDYLDFLVTEVGAAVDNMDALQDTVNRLADAPQFSHLKHFDTWHRTNINRAYLQFEAE